MNNCFTLTGSHNSFYNIIASCQFVKTYDRVNSYGKGYLRGTECDKEERRIMIHSRCFDVPDPNIFQLFFIYNREISSNIEMLNNIYCP